MRSVDDQLKSAICECLIEINNAADPVTREKWGPVVPPTAIDWIGNALVTAVLAVIHETDDAGLSESDGRTHDAD